MIGHALGVEARVQALLFNKLLRPNATGMEERPVQLLAGLGVHAMRNHRERRERSQHALRRRDRQVLRFRACNKTGREEAVEFVARTDEKRTQR